MKRDIIIIIMSHSARALKVKVDRKSRVVIQRVTLCTLAPPKLSLDAIDYIISQAIIS